jgi:acyl dehydratase
MRIRELSEIPPITGLYLKSAVSALRSGGSIPDERVMVHRVTVDADRVARYDRVCGFSFSDRMPPTFPHLLAFPLSLELMARPSFPFALPGLVHVTNSITQHRPIRVYEGVDVAVHLSDLRPHRNGRVFDVVARISVGPDTVWTSRSTYLARGDGDKDASGLPDDPGTFSPPHTATWRVTGDVGRRYGAVSGDRNPIHLSMVTARVFGFPRAIAHGMWTAARALASAESVLPDAFTYEFAFRKPLLLPSKVDFAIDEVDGHRRFEVRSAADPDVSHFHGRVRPLTPDSHDPPEKSDE